jgi:hypothetical protein
MCEVSLSALLQISSGLLTPVIAGLGIFIARQQLITNKGTLKEKLFDRRLEVFQDVQIFLTEIMRDATVKDSTWPSFHQAKQRASFLFGDDIKNILKKSLIMQPKCRWRKLV